MEVRYRLAAGAFVSLDGNKEGALPGVLVSAGALTGADAAGGLGNKFLVQVAGGVNFGRRRLSAHTASVLPAANGGGKRPTCRWRVACGNGASRV